MCLHNTALNDKRPPSWPVSRSPVCPLGRGQTRGAGPLTRRGRWSKYVWSIRTIGRCALSSPSCAISDLLQTPTSHYIELISGAKTIFEPNQPASRCTTARRWPSCLLGQCAVRADRRSLSSTIASIWSRSSRLDVTADHTFMLYSELFSSTVNPRRSVLRYVLVTRRPHRTLRAAEWCHCAAVSTPRFRITLVAEVL